MTVLGNVLDLLFDLGVVLVIAWQWHHINILYHRTNPTTQSECQKEEPHGRW